VTSNLNGHRGATKISSVLRPTDDATRGAIQGLPQNLIHVPGVQQPCCRRATVPSWMEPLCDFMGAIRCTHDVVKAVAVLMQATVCSSPRKIDDGPSAALPSALFKSTISALRATRPQPMARRQTSCGPAHSRTNGVRGLARPYAGINPLHHGHVLSGWSDQRGHAHHCPSTLGRRRQASGCHPTARKSDA